MSGAAAADPEKVLVVKDAEQPGYGSASANASRPAQPTAAPSRPARNSAPFVLTEAPPLWVALNPLIWILWLLDFIISLLPFFWFKFCTFCLRGVQSQEYQDKARRSAPELMTAPFPGCMTAFEVLDKAFKDYAHLECMGTRSFEGLHTPEGERFPLKVFGETSWRSYQEVKERAYAFGSGLVSLGVAPMPAEVNNDVLNFNQINGPHCILVFEETCADWTTVTIGAMSQSIAVATSYATLGMDAVGEAVLQTNSPVVVCNYKDVAKVATIAETQPCLKTIIYTRNYVEEDKPALAGEIGSVRVLSMEEVVNMGKSAGMEPSPPTPDHVGLIMYTSGSTGKPKGVMLKQSTICAGIAGLENYFCENVSDRATSGATQEVYLAYLPAAHILEFTAEMSMLAHGAKLGFADPRTISSKGALRKLPDGSLNGEPTGFGSNPPGAIQEFGPTCMAAVPKIWDIIKKGAEAKLGAVSPVLQAVILAAFAARSLALQQGRSTPLFDLVFNKFYRLVGGRIKVAVSGGGPISADVQNFFRVAFKLPLIQGYGLTETCSTGTVQPMWSVENSVVGPPIKSVEIKLSDCTEVLDRENQPYLNTDTMHLGTRCLGRGEVWIRGGPVSSGYYMLEDKTREEFDAEGWFHTGDIAIWTQSGMLKIVDRLKNLVKLKGGEYVAIEAMEATYSQSVYVNGVNGGLMCYGDGDMDRPVALVQVNVYELKKWADSNSVAYTSPEDLCANPAAAKHVCQALNAIGKGKLGGNEALAAVVLLPGTGPQEGTSVDCPWTPENQYLTASNKLNRKPILSGFESLMTDLKKKGIK